MTRWIGPLAAIGGAALAATWWVRRLRLFKLFRLTRKVIPVRTALRGATKLAKR